MSKEETQQVWRDVDAVCFDVDSTVMTDEALDELANFCGAGQQVREWTNKAMSGNVSFREALEARLNLFKPSFKNLHDFITSHTPAFTPGIKELVSVLHLFKVNVYLVSGGFKSIIIPAAKELNIPEENIFANRLKFYYNGEYAGFDEDQPTSSSGGKKLVVQHLKDTCGYKRLVMIGDGATDMEACPPADAFIGFGGNVVRDRVKSKAAWFVTNFDELISDLKNHRH